MTDTQYDRDILLLRALIERLAPWALGDPEADPFVQLEKTESDRDKARGLRAALRDLLVAARRLGSEELSAIDREMRRAGGTTTREFAIRSTAVIDRVLARKQVRNEEEYYALKSVLDGLGDDAKHLRMEIVGLVDAYEQALPGQESGDTHHFN